MTKKKTRQYVDDEQLTLNMTIYAMAYKDAIANGKEPVPMWPFLGEDIYETARHIARSHNFIKYSYLEDMISEACLNAVQYAHNFDPSYLTKKTMEIDGVKYNYPSAFAYISFNIGQAFSGVITDEKKEQYLKLKSYQNLVDNHGDLLDDIGDVTDNEEVDQSQSDIFTDITGKIASFEEKMEEKREKQRLKYKASVYKPPEIRVSSLFGD